MQLFHPLVGVFDSGIGGLNVLDACAARCPGACYLYFGDNAHAPYGSRTQGEIVSLTRRAMRLFCRHGWSRICIARWKKNRPIWRWRFQRMRNIAGCNLRFV